MSPVQSTIIFLGAPGSGKGTQSSRLSLELDVPCLSTGDALRSEASRNTVAGSKLRQLLASGSLASDELVCSIVGAQLRRKPRSILDGFPRNVKQARYLDSLVSSVTVIHLHVSRRTVLRRLAARRREDDVESVVLRRYAEFERLSAPLIEYYRGPNYHRIDGDRDADAVARDILQLCRPAVVGDRFIHAGVAFEQAHQF